MMQVIACKSILVPVAHVLDVIFQGHPNLLLFFVMIMCPLTMNVLQVSKPSSDKMHQYVKGRTLAWCCLGFVECLCDVIDDAANESQSGTNGALTSRTCRAGTGAGCSP